MSSTADFPNAGCSRVCNGFFRSSRFLVSRNILGDTRSASWARRKTNLGVQPSNPFVNHSYSLPRRYHVCRSGIGGPTRIIRREKSQLLFLANDPYPRLEPICSPMSYCIINVVVLCHAWRISIELLEQKYSHCGVMLSISGNGSED